MAAHDAGGASAPLSMVHEPTRVEASRQDLLAPADGDLALDPVRAAVAAATTQLVVVQAEPGHLRLVDAWLAPDAFVTQSRRRAPDEAVATFLWEAAWAASALAELFRLDAEPAPGRAGSPVPLGAAYPGSKELVEAVVAGELGPQAEAATVTWQSGRGPRAGVARVSVDGWSSWARLEEGRPLLLRGDGLLECVRTLFGVL